LYHRKNWHFTTLRLLSIDIRFIISLWQFKAAANKWPASGGSASCLWQKTQADTRNVLELWNSLEYQNCFNARTCTFTHCVLLFKKNGKNAAFLISGGMSFWNMFWKTLEQLATQSTGLLRTSAKFCPKKGLGDSGGLEEIEGIFSKVTS